MFDLLIQLTFFSEKRFVCRVNKTKSKVGNKSYLKGEDNKEQREHLKYQS